MHIINPPGIRLLFSYRMRNFLTIASIPCDLIHIWTLIIIGQIFAAVKRCQRPGSTGIFPFRFRRQPPILTCHTAKTIEKLLAIMPTDSINGSSRMYIGKTGWIISHYLFPFFLSNRIFSNFKPMSKSDFMLNFIPQSALFLL